MLYCWKVTTKAERFGSPSRKRSAGPVACSRTGRRWYVFSNRLQTEWIRIRDAFELLGADRVHGHGLIKPDVLIELTRQHGLEIVTLKLRLRPIDHSDGTLQPRLP